MPDVKHFDTAEVVAAVERLFWRHGAAATGIKDIESATGLSRSSIYNSFGSKEELFRTTLQRYVDERSRPMFDQLSGDDRGLPAIADFFDQLIRIRCFGKHARWGCLIANSHTEHTSQSTRALLDQHYADLRSAFAAALGVSRRKKQTRRDIDDAGTSEMLTLLAYGVNVRSRLGASPAALSAGVESALRSLAPANQ